MILEFTKSEFDGIPFRDDVVGDYVDGACYRARAYPTLIFRRRGDSWDAFGVDLRNRGFTYIPVV